MSVFSGLTDYFNFSPEKQEPAEEPEKTPSEPSDSYNPNKHKLEVTPPPAVNKKVSNKKTPATTTK